MSAALEANAGERLTSALSAFLTRKFAAEVTISAMRQLAGGASHETWAFDATIAGGTPPTLSLVLRRAYADGLIDSAMHTEFLLLEKLHQLGLPVPRAWFYAPACDGIATPFMIIARAAGTDLRKVLAQQPGTRNRAALGHTLVRHQAEIHALPWQSTLVDLVPHAGSPRAELARWTATIERRADLTSPLLGAATDWLGANPPPAATPVFIHGDFKTNNIVYDEQAGSVILDWELAHVGDPLEDLAWTLLWQTDDDLVGGLLSREDYLATYTQLTDTDVDPRRLFYWEMFSLVKLASIFIAGITPDQSRLARPVLFMLGRALPWIDARLGSLLLRTVASRTAA